LELNEKEFYMKEKFPLWQLIIAISPILAIYENYKLHKIFCLIGDKMVHLQYLFIVSLMEFGKKSGRRMISRKHRLQQNIAWKLQTLFDRVYTLELIKWPTYFRPPIAPAWAVLNFPTSVNSMIRRSRINNADQLLLVLIESLWVLDSYGCWLSESLVNDGNFFIWGSFKVASCFLKTLRMRNYQVRLLYSNKASDWLQRAEKPLRFIRTSGNFTFGYLHLKKNMSVPWSLE
jgi:hypothetical protein